MEPIQPSTFSISYQPSPLASTSDLGRLANHPHLKEEEKMEAVAKEFEVMLVKQVLKSAQQPMTDSGSTLFPTQGTGAIYGDMMVDTMAGSIGRAGQLGLARMFQQQLASQPMGETNPTGSSENDLKSKRPQ
jgi:Rod binding domain-containing protein